MGTTVSYMKNWISPGNPYYANLGPNPDDPDPTSGLTKRDVANIHYTWDIVKQDLKLHGTGFFLMFFEKYPKSQDKFKPFKGIPLSQLKDSKRLAGHGSTVMSAIDSYIVNLDDLECVVEMLHTTGVNHKDRGVTTSDFETIPDVFVEYMKKNLATVWTADIEKSWYKLLNLVIKVILTKF